jgi:hypothetical protein
LLQVKQRASVGSKWELEKSRRRFDEDRNTQILSAIERHQLDAMLKRPDIVSNFDDTLALLGRCCIRGLGMIDHVTASYDWYAYHDLPKTNRKIKPQVIVQGSKVHVFKIAKVYEISPIAFDSTNNKYVPLSPHDARLSNTAYEGTIIVDEVQWVCKSLL